MWSCGVGILFCFGVRGVLVIYTFGYSLMRWEVWCGYSCRFGFGFGVGGGM